MIELGTSGFVSWNVGSLPSNFSVRGSSDRYLFGAKIESVRADRYDRILRIRLERANKSGVLTYGELLLELIPPQTHLILLSENSQIIKGVWSVTKSVKSGINKGTREIQVGEHYVPPIGGRKLHPAESTIEIFSELLKGQLIRCQGNLSRALKCTLVGADKWITKELIHRSGMPKEHMARITTKDANDCPTELFDQIGRSLFTVAASMYKDFENQLVDSNTRGWVFTYEQKDIISGFEPKVPVKDCRPFDSILSAYSYWRCKKNHVDVRNKMFIHARQLLVRELRQVQRTVKALERDFDEVASADELTKKGNIILANLKDIMPGLTCVELPDSFSSSDVDRVTIDLDRYLSPSENAARFLKKARKLEKRRSVLPKRLRLARGREQLLKDLISELHATTADVLPEGTKKWMTERELSSPQKKSERDSPRPRRYKTTSGWTVWVGRNQSENDLLTHRKAAQEDLWFHASGYSGSHVVLRREGRKDEPSVRTVKEVAAVAAYWSKGRSAKKVPVVYTQIKYVSKPRGGAPGLAVLKREKTVIVSPKLLTLFDEGS